LRFKSGVVPNLNKNSGGFWKTCVRGRFFSWDLANALFRRKTIYISMPPLWIIAYFVGGCKILDR